MSRTIQRCLDEKVLTGKLSRQQADEALRRIKERRAFYEASLGEDQAAVLAAREVAETMLQAAERKRAEDLGHILAMTRLEARLKAHPDGMQAAGMAIVSRDIRHKDPGVNIDTAWRRTEATAHSFMAEPIEKLRSHAAGLRQDTATARQTVRALFGETTNNPLADATAKGFRAASDWLVRRFNAVGGHIEALVGWNIPQHHNRKPIKAAGFETWRAFLLPLLDRSKIIDFDTMQPMSDARLLARMEEDYNDIISGGLSSIEPGRATGKGSIRERHNRQRFYHFKGAAAWMAYNDRFGAGPNGIFDVLMGHMHGMSRDIAILEVMGPKADQAARVVHGLLKQADNTEASPAPRWPFSWAESPETFWSTWESLNGTLGTPGSPRQQRRRDFWASVRGFVASADLDRAMMSAFSDLHTFLRASAWNGLPAARLIGQAVAGMVPGNAAHRVEATKMGIMAYHARNGLASRFIDAEQAGGTLGESVMDTVMRAQGLSIWTHELGSAAQMGLRSMLGDLTDTAFDALPDRVTSLFKRYGVTAADWDIVRAGTHPNANGARFLDPAAILRDLGQSPERFQAAARIADALQQEADFFVLKPDSRVRAMMSLGTQAGTGKGELIRSLGMYKSFSVTVLTTHIARDIGESQSIGRALGRSGGMIAGAAAIRIAGFVAGMTLFGAFITQMRQISEGRDPLDMTTGDFWLRAGLQGGGLGLFGDILQAGGITGTERMAQALGGPVAGIFADIAKLGFPVMRRVLDGEDVSFLSQVFETTIRRFPGADLWYLQQVLDRLVWDQIMRWGDPDFDAGVRRMERRARKLYGQEHWWRRGETSPERMPNLGAVLGEGR